VIDVRCKGCGVLQLKCTMFIGAIKCKSCRKIFEYKVLTDIHMTNLEDPKETKKKVLQSRTN